MNIEMIDTDDIVLPQKTIEANNLRNGNIRIFLNDLAQKDLSKNPQKKIKHITNYYIRYLSSKLNSLYLKYNGEEEYGNCLFTIFHTNVMSDLLTSYYHIMNPSPEGNEKEQKYKEVKRLFELLEQEYSSKYNLPITSLIFIKEYTEKSEIFRYIV
jgi:hypothetical protein